MVKLWFLTTTLLFNQNHDGNIEMRSFFFFKVSTCGKNWLQGQLKATLNKQIKKGKLLKQNIQFYKKN